MNIVTDRGDTAQRPTGNQDTDTDRATVARSPRINGATVANSTHDGQKIRRTAEYIARLQQPGGAVPWFKGGIIDPWDHVEAAMGLSVGGYTAEAAHAYAWLARMQRADGAWFAAYREDVAVDCTRAETNFVAYVATGVWHHYRVTGDTAFLERLWPCVQRAIDFVLTLQAPTGEIYWALDSRTGINKDALLTGCSSIYRSLACAANAAQILNLNSSRIEQARDQLGHTLVHRPERFDRTWPSKSRYSMDWFYPVLAGLYSTEDARVRLLGRWSEFVEQDLGCRCVADEPWVTVAETCELSMACLAAGLEREAEELFSWLSQFQAEDGSWWTGFAMRDQVLWPDERPTWTAGAILLADDALNRRTAAHNLFVTTA